MALNTETIIYLAFIGVVTGPPSLAAMVYQLACRRGSYSRLHLAISGALLMLWFGLLLTVPQALSSHLYS